MITTSTGAKKIENTDNWREIFDAHNDSVDAEDKLAQDTAPIVNGNKSTTGASAGEYVLVRNSSITGITDGAYKAAQAIPANTAIDSTYLTAITGGIANDLNSKITQINGNTTFTQVSSKNVDSGQTFQFAILTSGWYILRIQFNEAGNAGDEAQIKIGNNVLMKVIACGTRWFQQGMWVSLKAGTTLTYVASSHMTCGFEVVQTA